MAQLKPLDIVIRGIDRVTGPINKINRKLEAMNAPVRRLNRSFSALNRESGLARIGGAAANVGREIGALARRAALVGSAFGAAAAAGMKAFIDTADGVAKTADKLGIGVEAWQELLYVADRAGVQQAEMTTAMRTFTKGIGDAARGTGEAKRAFDALGVSIRDQATGQIRSADSLLAELADKLGGVENETLRAALAMQLFGTRGVGMVNVLKDGSAAMSDLRRRARDLGLVMSEETARRAEIVADQLTDLRAVVTGVGYQIAGELLPSVRRLVQRVLDWTEKNRELIRVAVPQFLEKVVEGFEWALAAAKRWIPRILSLVSNLGGLNTVLGLVAGTMATKLVVSIGALSTALMTTPAGWVIASVAAITFALSQLIWHFDAVKAAASSAWDWLTTPIGPRRNFFKDRAERLAAKRSEVGGEITVRFEGAPPGSRVTKLEGHGGIDLAAEVGGYSLAPW